MTQNGIEKSCPSVLVVGVFLMNRPNNADHIMATIQQSHNWNVDQKWVAFGSGELTDELKTYTVLQETAMRPKFSILNRILRDCDLENYDFVIVCDDDISLPENFLDQYLEFVLHYDFSLAQPARTLNSYIDHYFVAAMEGLLARRTRFVEIGPIFSIRKDAFTRLLPFDEASPMGWGYDFMWPCIIESAKLKMGIVDAVPVEHSMRKPVENYNYDESVRTMTEFLADKPHFSRNEAFRIVESYA